MHRATTTPRERRETDLCRAPTPLLCTLFVLAAVLALAPGAPPHSHTQPRLSLSEGTSALAPPRLRPSQGRGLWGRPRPVVPNGFNKRRDVYLAKEHKRKRGEARAGSDPSSDTWHLREKLGRLGSGQNPKHERWRERANGPMVEWKVVKGPCPGSKAGYSCADPGSKTIFLNKYDWNDKHTYYHEHGHAFDRELLTDQDRAAIAERFGWKGRWFWGDWNPETHAAEPNEERFADMYAKMLTHPRKGIWLRRYLRAVLQQARPA